MKEATDRLQRKYPDDNKDLELAGGRHEGRHEDAFGPQLAKWYAYGDEIATFLSGANPLSMRHWISF